MIYCYISAGHVGEAKLVVLEEKYEGVFTILTRVSGTVRVVFTNEKDNNSFVKGIDGKIEQIVRDAMNESTWQPTDVISIDKDSRSVVCKTVGRCQFKYGVKQMVEVDQKKIDPTAFNSRIDED